VLDDNDQLRLAILHCQDVIDKCQQEGLCKNQHLQLKRWLEELLTRRLEEIFPWHSSR